MCLSSSFDRLMLSRLPRLTAALTAALLLAACDGTAPIATSATPEVDLRLNRQQTGCPGIPASTKSLTLSPGSVTLRPGQQATFTAINQNGVPVAACALTWATSAPEVVSVTATGVATARTVGGPVTITARTGGARPAIGTAAAYVVSPVTSIEVQHYGVYVNGDTGTFAFRALDASGTTLQGLTYTMSTDASVLTPGALQCGIFGCLQRLRATAAGPVSDAIDRDIVVTTPGTTVLSRFRVRILPSAIDSVRALTFEESFGASPRSVSIYPTLTAQVGQSIGLWPVVFWAAGQRSQTVSNAEYSVLSGAADIVRAMGGWGNNVAQADYVSVVPRALGELVVLVRFRLDNGTWIEHQRHFTVSAP